MYKQQEWEILADNIAEALEKDRSVQSGKYNIIVPEFELGFHVFINGSEKMLPLPDFINTEPHYAIILYSAEKDLVYMMTKAVEAATGWKTYPANTLNYTWVNVLDKEQYSEKAVIYDLVDFTLAQFASKAKHSDLFKKALFADAYRAKDTVQGTYPFKGIYIIDGEPYTFDYKIIKVSSDEIEVAVVKSYGIRKDREDIITVPYKEEDLEQYSLSKIITRCFYEGKT